MAARRYRVLGVDDSEDDLLLLRLAFRHAPLLTLVATVRDGRDAIAYLKGEGRYAERNEFPIPDLILLDLKLPRLDGFGVLDWLRQQPRALTRVVMLTSSLDAADRSRALGLGADGFEIKPVDPDGYKRLAQTLELRLAKWGAGE